MPNHSPQLGYCNTVLGFLSCETQDMSKSTREVLADNLNRLMEKRGDSCISLAQRSGVSHGTIDRLRKAQVSAGVDHLDGIAKAYGIEAADLLGSGVKSDAGPWPFALVQREDIEHLSDLQRRMVESATLEALAKVEALGAGEHKANQRRRTQ